VGAGTRTGGGVRPLGVGVVADGVGVVVADPADGDDAVAVGAVLLVWVVGMGRPQPASAPRNVVIVTTAASTRITGKVLTSSTTIGSEQPS
jgi:hypothetical protein